MDSVALALFRFFSRTRQKAGAAVRAPGAAPHPHPHECNYAGICIVFTRASINILAAKDASQTSAMYRYALESLTSGRRCLCRSTGAVQGGSCLPSMRHQLTLPANLAHYPDSSLRAAESVARVTSRRSRA